MSVLVTGSFDLLHSGHIEFLRQASQYGKLFVGIGSDASIAELKNRPTIFTQEERLFMIRAIKYVEDAWINKGMGNIDFAEDIRSHNTFIDTLVVNEDQDFMEKRWFCGDEGIRYVVLKRVPHPGLPERSSTTQRRYYD